MALWPNTPYANGFAVPLAGMNAQATPAFIQVLGTNVLRFQSGGCFPAGDGSIALGDPSLKWTTLHALSLSPNRTNGTPKRVVNVAEQTGQSGAGATVNFAATPALTDNAVTKVVAWVSGGKDNEAEGVGYLLVGTYRRTGGGAPILCGAVAQVYVGETDATANATLVITGNTVEVQGLSPAGDVYDWEASVDWLVRP